MPNGNVMLIVYELKSSSEVTQAGCKWAHTMWPDKIIEVEPSGASGGNIVWEWHAWDHLVQDYDPSKANYGVVAEHPELLDINYNNSQQTKDWLHVNGIDYNEELDQIVISSHFLNELYVVDHSTTTEEAAGHTGGNSGKGGDILYRWGNPAAYDARRYSKCYVEGTLIEAPVIILHDDTLFASYGATFQWYLNGLPLAGADDPYLVPLSSGSYQVKITDAGECESELSDPYNYEFIGIAEQNANIALHIYPVPTQGLIYLHEEVSLAELREIVIFDQSGRSVLESEPVRSLDLSSLDSGLYFLIAKGNKQVLYTAKIILIR